MATSYASFNKFYGKMSLGFVLKMEDALEFLNVLFYNQQKDLGFL